LLKADRDVQRRRYQKMETMAESAISLAWDHRDSYFDACSTGRSAGIHAMER
jgi:hypothetical protein